MLPKATSTLPSTTISISMIAPCLFRRIDWMNEAIQNLERWRENLLVSDKRLAFNFWDESFSFAHNFFLNGRNIEISSRNKIISLSISFFLVNHLHHVDIVKTLETFITSCCRSWTHHGHLPFFSLLVPFSTSTLPPIHVLYVEAVSVSFNLRHLTRPKSAPHTYDVMYVPDVHVTCPVLPSNERYYDSFDWIGTETVAENWWITGGVRSPLEMTLSGKSFLTHKITNEDTETVVEDLFCCDYSFSFFFLHRKHTQIALKH